MSLLAVFADVLPKEEIINLIEERISAYRLDPTEKNMKLIETSCLILVQKTAHEQNGGMEKTISEMEKIKRIKERMDGANQ